MQCRPVILPDYAELELRIADDSRCPAVACFDGRETVERALGDSVRVRMSPNPVPTVNHADRVGGGQGGGPGGGGGGGGVGNGGCEQV